MLSLALPITLLFALEAPPSADEPFGENADTEGAGLRIAMMSPVVDMPGVLGDPVKSDLAARLAEHKERSGVAVGVLILASRGTRTMEKTGVLAAQILAQGWGHDAPVAVIVIATQEHQLRITGSDELAELFDDDATAELSARASAAFAAGDFDRGVTELVEGVITLTPSVPQKRPPVVTTPVAVATAVALVLVLAGAGAGALVVVVRKRRRRT